MTIDKCHDYDDEGCGACRRNSGILGRFVCEGPSCEGYPPDPETGHDGIHAPLMPTGADREDDRLTAKEFCQKVIDGFAWDEKKEYLFRRWSGLLKRLVK